MSEKDFPRFELKFGGKHKKRVPAEIDAAEFIAEKSNKAKGKRLSSFEIASVTELKPIRFREDMPAQPEIPDTPETIAPPESTALPEPENGTDKPVLPGHGLNGEQMSLF
jgi:topoisomerase-4 subunit A